MTDRTTAEVVSNFLPRSTTSYAVSDITADSSAVRILGIPWALEQGDLPEGSRAAPPGSMPDVVVLTEVNAVGLMREQMSQAMAAIVPVVDAAPSKPNEANARSSDISIGRASRGGLTTALHVLTPTLERLRQLPASVPETKDPRMMLLARLFVRNAGFEPRRDPLTRDTIFYSHEEVLPGARSYCEDLVSLGLMERSFSDNLILCPFCESARLTAREYCQACRSANLVEEPIIHHMRCAYQAPEQEFRSGSDLVCPKCRKHLQQFSVDYDRPGSVCVCRSCGHVSTDSAVGFVCLDCETMIAAGDTATRAVYAYSLTSSGSAAVLAGSPLPKRATFESAQAMRILSFIERQRAIGEPCCVLAVRLREPPGTPAGGATWRQTCNFFASLMRECFTRETEIVESAPLYIALLAKDDKPDVERALPLIRARLERHLVLAPRIDYSVYAPEEIRALVKRSLPRR